MRGGRATYTSVRLLKQSRDCTGPQMLANSRCSEVAARRASAISSSERELEDWGGLRVFTRERERGWSCLAGRGRAGAPPTASRIGNESEASSSDMDFKNEKAFNMKCFYDLRLPLRAVPWQCMHDIVIC